MEKITVNRQNEQVKIVVMWDESSLVVVRQSGGSWVEAARVGITSRLWIVIRYSVRGMRVHSRKS